MVAACHGHVEVVQGLLANEVDEFARNEVRGTARRAGMQKGGGVAGSRPAPQLVGHCSPRHHSYHHQAGSTALQIAEEFDRHQVVQLLRHEAGAGHDEALESSGGAKEGVELGAGDGDDDRSSSVEEGRYCPP